jgi:lipopolysaccharide export LptBFGC system permease protein LptF
MKIWQRTLFFSHLNTLFWTLLSFFLLYSLIDLSFHPWLFKSLKVQGPFLLIHFSYIQFIRKLHLFLPFSYLLSLIYTLAGSSQRQELLVLLTSGISKIRIFKVFFLVAVFVTLLNFINTQFLVPLATNQLMMIKYPAFSQYLEKPTIKQFEFEGGSFLVFRSYNPSNKQYEDVYFKKDELLFHAKSVQKEQGFVGHFVDLFKAHDGHFSKIGSFSKLPLLKLNLTPIDESLIQKDPNEHSLSMLHKLQKMSIYIPGLLAKLKAAYHFKLVFLVLGFLILVAAFPFSIQYSKSYSYFKVYALFIFGFVMLYLLFKGATILVEGELASPFACFWAPFILLFLGCLIPFKKRGF